MWERIARIEHKIVVEPEDHWCDSCKHRDEFDSCFDCMHYDHYEKGEEDAVMHQTSPNDEAN